MLVGLTQCAASVYAMLRGFIVVIVAFYSIILLKHRYTQRKWISIVAIFIGVAIVGIVSV